MIRSAPHGSLIIAGFALAALTGCQHWGEARIAMPDQETVAQFETAVEAGLSAEDRGDFVAREKYHATAAALSEIRFRETAGSGTEAGYRRFIAAGAGLPTEARAARAPYARLAEEAILRRELAVRYETAAQEDTAEAYRVLIGDYETRLVSSPLIDQARERLAVLTAPETLAPGSAAAGVTAEPVDAGELMAGLKTAVADARAQWGDGPGPARSLSPELRGEYEAFEGAFLAGDLATAEPHARKVADLAARDEGRAGAHTIDATRNLARLLRKSGRYDDAVAEAKKALAMREALSGKGHESVVGVMRDIAEIYVESDRLPAAENFYQQALAILEKTLAADDPAFADYLFGLAIVYEKQGRFEESEPLMKRARDIEKKASGVS